MKRAVLCLLVLPFSFLISSFSLKINVNPSELFFPVAGKRAIVGSFWGAIRDGGKRKHEGIDIFAKRGTPVIAVSDGYVAAVTNGGRGGKTVWLRSTTYQWTEYYAHLNEQHVRRGQWVKKGQIIGTVGNTGNAKLTPPHLHFGIYTGKGAVNPLPYVKSAPRLLLPKGVTTQQQMLAVKPPNTKYPPSKVQNEHVIDKKYIFKTITVPSDRASRYYVTVRNNVIRINKNKLVLIGKWLKSGIAKYPYQIILADSKKLTVTQNGYVLNDKGLVVARIS